MSLDKEDGSDPERIALLWTGTSLVDVGGSFFSSFLRIIIVKRRRTAPIMTIREI
jgi:hypothetical protein